MARSDGEGFGFEQAECVLHLNQIKLYRSAAVPFGLVVVHLDSVANCLSSYGVTARRFASLCCNTENHRGGNNQENDEGLSSHIFTLFLRAGENANGTGNLPYIW